ncbi:hypothetical protein ABN080_01035 [Proteus sp. fly-1089]|uniref:hypothetical protein n=1 Tax=Proteus sp. fly-1089 TaxID=3136675 RepID=UPI0032DBEBD1
MTEGYLSLPTPTGGEYSIRPAPKPNARPKIAPNVSVADVALVVVTAGVKIATGAKVALSIVFPGIKVD